MMAYSGYIQLDVYSYTFLVYEFYLVGSFSVRS